MPCVIGLKCVNSWKGSRGLGTVLVTNCKRLIILSIR